MCDRRKQMTMTTNSNDCMCQERWKKIVELLDYFKEFLKETVEEYPSLVIEIEEAVWCGQDEVERKIDSLTRDLCRVCGQYNETIDCIDENGESNTPGCDASHHHVLEG